MGHPHGRLSPGGLVRRTRRRHQRSGGGLLDRQISRLDEKIGPAAGARHDLLRIGTGAFTERAPKLGGLIEFYRSPARVQWTPTGNNVPDYPKLAQLWWQNIGDASSGSKTPQAAMDALAAAQDSVMERLEKSGVQGACGPKLNNKEKPEYWFKKAEKDGTTAPQRNLPTHKPHAQTVASHALIKSWPASPPKRAEVK